MLSPKSSDITANNGAFDSDAKALWLPVLTGSRIFSRATVNFGDVKSKLDGVQASSIQAKQLNETMKLIDRLGPVNASTKGSEGEFSTLDNREDLIEYAFAVLYGQAFLPRLTNQTVAVPNEAVF